MLGCKITKSYIVHLLITSLFFNNQALCVKFLTFEYILSTLTVKSSRVVLNKLKIFNDNEDISTIIFDVDLTFWEENKTLHYFYFLELIKYPMSHLVTICGIILIVDCMLVKVVSWHNILCWLVEVIGCNV